jgi:alanine racemase
MARPSQIYIDLAALVANYRLACLLAPKAKTMAIIKANAYGHGAINCARSLQHDAPAFGVACIEEALQLRQAGIKQPILLLEGCFTVDELEIVAQHQFCLMVENPLQVDMMCNVALTTPLQTWVKIDTGMHRLGLNPTQVPSLYQRLLQSGNVASPITFATHFASADEINNDFTQQQVRCFQQAVKPFNSPTSLANSAAILAWPAAHAEWNRAGFMLYGASPLTHPTSACRQLQPVMELTSAIISLRRVETGDSVGYGQQWVATRPSTIATIAIGYGDGYPRNTPSGTPVLIQGQRAPLAGRVSMDMITVDVTHIPAAAIGDRVTLWGKHLSVNEIAKACGTIGYELLTRLTGRLPISNSLV